MVADGHLDRVEALLNAEPLPDSDELRGRIDSLRERLVRRRDLANRLTALDEYYRDVRYR